MDQASPPKSDQSKVSDLEIEKLVLESKKLALEIESLRKKNRRDIIRFVTTVVTIAGLLFGLYKFYAEQQKDRATREADQKLRFQSQVRTDIDEILSFTQDKNLTISRASFLLDDLKTLLQLTASLNENQRTVESSKIALTKGLVYLITYDSDFQNSPRDVSFALTACEQWDYYRGYLQEHPAELNLILYKHVRAIRYLRDTYPRYLEHINYYGPTNQYFVLPRYEKQKGEEDRFQHFKHIRDSFREHLKLTENDPRPEVQKIRAQSLRDFEAALCNKIVAKQVLGPDFKDEPCEK